MGLSLKSVTEWYKRQPRIVQKLLLGADIVIGGKLFHDPPGVEKTVSEHLAEQAKAGNPIGLAGCAVLNEADPGHCMKADDPNR